MTQGKCLNNQTRPDRANVVSHNRKHSCPRESFGNQRYCNCISRSRKGKRRSHFFSWPCSFESRNPLSPLRQRRICKIVDPNYPCVGTNFRDKCTRAPRRQPFASLGQFDHCSTTISWKLSFKFRPKWQKCIRRGRELECVHRSGTLAMPWTSNRERASIFCLRGTCSASVTTIKSPKSKL